MATLGGWHIGISQYSDRKAEAWKWIQFVTSYETQKSLALEIGWNPGRKDVYEDGDVIASLPHFRVLKDVFEQALPRPNVPYYTQISEVLQQSFNAVIAGELTPQEGLFQAEDAVQKIQQRYQGL